MRRIRVRTKREQGASVPRADRGRRRHRVRRLFAVIGIVVLAAVLVLAGGNAVLERIERAAPAAYGERVSIEGGSVNVYRRDGSGPTIVLLSGYDTAAPALDFAPLIRQLDGYRVVVVEGFGYGYSDTEQVPARTIENVTAELHQTLAELGIRGPVVLAAHSLGGIYSLYYANRYPGEVSAVIGIDASVPGQMNGLAGGRSSWERLVPDSGLLRAASSIVPWLVEPDSDAYTDEEREGIRRLSNWNYANPALIDEADQASRNFAAVEHMVYPEEVPVLSFIKKEGNQPRWRELHEAQVLNRDRGELVELDGGHYLHWTQSERMGRAIADFLEQSRIG